MTLDADGRPHAAVKVQAEGVPHIGFDGTTWHDDLFPVHLPGRSAIATVTDGSIRLIGVLDSRSLDGLGIARVPLPVDEEVEIATFAGIGP